MDAAHTQDMSWRIVVTAAGARTEVRRCSERDARRDAARLATLDTDAVAEPVTDEFRADLPMATAHVHAQPAWHADAHIEMNTAAAAGLAVAALDALETGRGVASVACTDGEGYALVLAVSDPDSERPGPFDPWALPYTDPIAGGPDPVPADVQVRELAAAFGELSLEDRAALPDRLAVAVDAIAARVRVRDGAGGLLSDDDPRRDL